MDSQKNESGAYATSQVDDVEMVSLSHSERMEAEDCAEYEPFDTEKEKYIDQDLLDKFDFHVVTTTHMRKACPSQVKSKLKKIFRHELKYIHSAQVEVETDKTVDETCSVLRGQFSPEECFSSEESVEERLQGTGSKVEETSQKCREVLSKARELVKSIELYKKFQNSDVHQVLSETPPTTPNRLESESSCFTETHLNKCINRKLNVT